MTEDKEESALCAGIQAPSKGNLSLSIVWNLALVTTLLTLGVWIGGLSERINTLNDSFSKTDDRVQKNTSIIAGMLVTDSEQHARMTRIENQLDRMTEETQGRRRK